MTRRIKKNGLKGKSQKDNHGNNNPKGGQTDSQKNVQKSGEIGYNEDDSKNEQHGYGQNTKTKKGANEGGEPEKSNGNPNQESGKGDIPCD